MSRARSLVLFLLCAVLAGVVAGVVGAFGVGLGYDAAVAVLR